MTGPTDSASTARDHGAAGAVDQPGNVHVAFRLRIIASHEAWRTGQEILVTAPVTIGRGLQCECILTDAGVSRQHARVVAAEGGLKLQDLGSGNGVWVGNERIATTLLRHGQQFQIGSTRFECVEVPRLESAPPRHAPAVATGSTPTAGFVLRVINEGAAAREVHIQGTSATIGRTSECDVIVAEPDVSRRHARVERDATGFRVVDLESTYGTWIGSQQVSEATLQPGESFRVGARVEIQYRVAEVPQRVAEVSGDSTDALTPALAVKPPVALADEADPAPSLDAAINASASPSDPDRTVHIALAREANAIGSLPLPSPDIAEEDDLDFSQTIVIPISKALAAQTRRVEQEGEEIALSAHAPFLLSDSSYAWYVVSGGIMLFGVAVENGQPVGRRTQLLGILPGQCCFGIDARRYGMASGILAAARPGTVVRKIPVARLREIANAAPSQREAVSSLLNTWVLGISQTVTRDIPIRRTGEIELKPGEQVTLTTSSKATSAEGVAWVDVWSGAVLVDDMATPVFARKHVLFPVTPHLWIQPIGDEFGDLVVTPVRTEAVITNADLWAGLDALQQVFCECEFINKKLAAADEFVRLEEKAKYARQAEAAGYEAIGSVLRAEADSLPELFDRTGAAPVLKACRLVGHVLGLEVRTTADVNEELPYEDHVAAIANASGFRTRLVALRDDWWRRDQGPLLAQLADSNSPVAVLPTTPTSNEVVDPRTDTRRKLTAEIAAGLAGFAYTFYRPLPGGLLKPGDVIRFGRVGLKRDFRTVALMAVMIGAIGTVTPYFTGQLFDSAIPQADRAMLFGFAIALSVSAVAGSLFKLTQGIATVRIQTRMESSIQAAVWDRLLDLPVTFFRRFAAGDLADRANGVEEIQELVSGAGVAAILGSISGLFFIIQMFTYNLRLALTALLLTFFYVATTMFANYAQLRYQRREVRLRGRIAGLVLNLIGGVSKLRVCGAEQHAFRVWAMQFAEQKRIGFSVGNIQNLSTTFGSVFPVISSIALFLVMINEQVRAAKNNEATLTVGEFIAFNASYGMFLAAMQALGEASLSLLRVVPIYERLSPILTTVPEVDRTKAFPGKLKGGIEISKLNFRYQPESPYIIKDLVLSIKPKEFVAFVGPSGCGKSTLMRLMLGFERPTSGAIAYDGQDISTIDVRMLRQQMGVVLQVSRVMPTELYRNITGATARTIEDAWEAAERAGLAEDVRQMPMGMHTYISEGGGTLSGGQRQRLMIARAIVGKPKVIFLDEATSALDNRTQAIVTDSLNKMDATRIVIAHRLSTIIQADKICYMEAGAIVEMGTHKELMALNGRFAELARRQMA